MILAPKDRGSQGGGAWEYLRLRSMIPDDERRHLGSWLTIHRCAVCGQPAQPPSPKGGLPCARDAKASPSRRRQRARQHRPHWQGVSDGLNVQTVGVMTSYCLLRRWLDSLIAGVAPSQAASSPPETHSCRAAVGSRAPPPVRNSKKAPILVTALLPWHRRRYLGRARQPVRNSHRAQVLF